MSKMGVNEGSVEATLKERQGVYGNYRDVCHTRAMIMDLLQENHSRVQGRGMDPRTEVMFSDVVLKLVRASGNPGYADSWHDLAGYATLIEAATSRGD